MHGATGAQGSPVLAALRAAGQPTVAAVRNTGDVPEGVDAISVDLADAAAITEAKPARVVISTSGQIVDQPGSALQSPENSPIQTLIRKVTESGVSVAVVATRSYLENLLLPVVIGPARGEGVLRYPLPESFSASWGSNLDVADVATRLLADTTVTGTIALGQLPGVTGPDLAAAFAQYLGRDVSYTALTPEQFGELISPLFGHAAAPVVGLYEALNMQDENVIAESNSAQRLLGVEPRSVLGWLAELGV